MTEQATPAAAPAADNGGTGTPQPAPAPTQPGTPDMGFPANTPVSEMTDAQRANYFKHHNRQSDNKLAAFKGVTPQDVETMQQELENLRNEKLSASDKALKEAATQASEAAKAAADAEWLPKLQAAQLKSIAAPILNDADRLSAFLEMANPANFVGENGEIDEEKVAGRLTSLFGTVQAATAQQARNWGQHSGGTGTPQKPGETGRAAAAKRHGIKT